ncbi:Alpha/Beta hydrolase protein [Crucibulum laeve]|uniref:Alpha/Beta hydrolase protein n=1 Tax=Crucibulum laeve TaxID=68775 RepID=A0A5C3M261_9AGAR|nr:Alpha/Beta hydrolase protein [Crucibulum laeve]
MPYISITSSTGPLDVHYSIATPTSPKAKSIVSYLPSVLFLHSGYIAQEIFETQFADPELRRFNLIAIDMRTFGETRGMIGKGRYTPTESAEDVYLFMEALKLPPCHIFGLAIGSTVALELAAAHPNRVRSLTLCSPLTPTEPEHVIAGRLEIHECWVKGAPHNVEEDPEAEIDQELVSDVVLGVTQLLFNNESNELISAIVNNGLAQAMHNLSGTPDKIKESYKNAVAWFIDRAAIPESALKKIQGPVSIIHCSEDLGYPLENAMNLAEQLRSAGASSVEFHQVPGPHYGNVTSAALINPILRDTVLSCENSTTPPPSPVPTNKEKMITPFSEKLDKYGYNPQDDYDSE